MKNFKIFVLIGFIILHWNTLNAKDIHVDKNSQSSVENGSTDNPYKSIQLAANTAVDGDVIWVHAGEYREMINIPINNLTFTRFGNDKVKINGADAILSWMNEGDNTYKGFMDWNVTEGNQHNQIFINGKMMNLLRWPKETTGNLSTHPIEAVADNVQEIGYKKYKITDNDFNEPNGKWNGAKIWFNVARNGNDGQGQSATVESTDQSTHTIIINTNHSISTVENSGEGPFRVGPGTAYFLFDPTAIGVSSAGGIKNILTENEWWKNGNDLFVHLPENQIPASSMEGNNIVEAKKRIFAFQSSELYSQRNNILIKGFDFFATSITTDRQYYDRGNIADDSHDNIIDGCNFKYVFHSIDNSGDWQIQWSGRSGIIISGKNNVLKNCTIQYSSASAVSIIGQSNKILNNLMFDLNYSVSESGGANFGGWNKQSYDHEFAYNTMYNNPEQMVQIRSFYNSNPNLPGVARIHHNVIHDFMLRAHDSGGIDNFGNDSKWLRIDHNVIYNAPGKLQIGIYLDFGSDPDGYGGRCIIDHNVIYNVDRPIQLNHIGYKNKQIIVSNNVAISSSLSKSGIVNDMEGDVNFLKYNELRNNILSSSLPYTFRFAKMEANIENVDQVILQNLFKNHLDGDFTLNNNALLAIDKGVLASPYDDAIVNLPDIGAFESGIEPWKAGVGNLTPEFALIDSVYRNSLTFKKGSGGTKNFNSKLIGYGGFNGSVELRVLNQPLGVSVSLDQTSIAENGIVNISVSVNEDAVAGMHTLTIEGKSGELTILKNYLINIHSIGTISEIKMDPPSKTVLTRSKTTLEAKAYDENGELFYPQPENYEWSCLCATTGYGISSVTGYFTAPKKETDCLVWAKYNDIVGEGEVKVRDNIVGIDGTKFNSNRIIIYPIPATDEINIRFTEKIVGPCQITIMNNLLRVIKIENYKGISENDLKTINVNELNSGLYFLRVQTPEGYSFIKALIVK